MTIEQGTLIALDRAKWRWENNIVQYVDWRIWPSSGTITLYTADGPVDITKRKAYQVAKLGVARTLSKYSLVWRHDGQKKNVLVARTTSLS